jgi:hypothetical protein
MAIADEFCDLAHFGRLFAAWVEPHSTGAVGGLPPRPISSIVYSSNMNKKRCESSRFNRYIKSANPVVPQPLTEPVEDYWNGSRPKAGVAGSNPAGGTI